MLESREGDDLSDINQAIGRVCLNDRDGVNTIDVDELSEQGHRSKPLLKCLGKCASFPSAGSHPSDDHGETETLLRCLFSEDSVSSPCSRSISLPTPLKLVSALKGSREKLGLPAKETRVTWSPDVYDPPPTSVLHTAKGKKQQKSKSKSKNHDKKKNTKKGHKGYSSPRGSSKDNKQFRRGSGSSDRWYDYKPLEPLEVHISGNLDGFKVISTDPFCGTSFLKKSPTRVNYSVAEALSKSPCF